MSLRIGKENMTIQRLDQLGSWLINLFMKLTLDTDTQVFFYEQDFYVLSNFSAFRVVWAYRRFDTSEAAYHYAKFPSHSQLQDMIQNAASAHAAFKIAESNKHLIRTDWKEIRVEVMKEILIAKVEQHEYVHRKLLATGDRELVENSWRDSFWGWGENRDGQNMLGKLWMEIRADLKTDGYGNVWKEGVCL